MLRAREVNAAYRALMAAGESAEILQDGTIEFKSASSVERPDDINCLLGKAGAPPTRLMVEEEELEQYFLRLVGIAGGLGNE